MFQQRFVNGFTSLNNFRDYIASGILFFSTIAIFATGSRLLGYYSDDSAFLASLPSQDFWHTIKSMGGYVPGRNLHILWQKLLFVIAGSRPDDLFKLHLWQSVFDATNVALFYVLARGLAVPSAAAFIAALVFAVYPNHGETHYWLTSGPMNLISTSFALAFILTTLHVRKKVDGDSTFKHLLPILCLDLLCFIGGLFTYDQAFFVLMLVLCIRIIWCFKNRLQKTYQRLLLWNATYLVPSVFYMYLKILGGGGGPPLTLTGSNLAAIPDKIATSLSFSFGDLFKERFLLLYGKSDVSDSVVAIFIGVISFIGFTVLSFKKSHKGRAKTEILQLLPVALFGVALFFLGYGPNYLWYISPRHNYLPTVGSCLVLGVLLGFLIVYLRSLSNRRSAFLACVIGLLFSSVIFAFTRANLAEKSDWIASYQIRKNLYEELGEKKLLRGKTTFLFDGFPPSLGVAPLFSQENFIVLQYLFPEQTENLAYGAPHSVETNGGYFFSLELGRVGPEAQRYVAKGSALRIVFEGLEEDRLKYAFQSEQYHQSRFYEVISLGTIRNSSQPSVSDRALLSAEVRGDPNAATSLLLTLRGDSLTLKRKEAFGLTIRSCDTPPSPLSANSSWGEVMAIPVLLAEFPNQLPEGAALYRIDFKNVAPLRPCHLVLHRFREDLPQTIETISVDQGKMGSSHWLRGAPEIPEVHRPHGRGV